MNKTLTLAIAAVAASLAAGPVLAKDAAQAPRKAVKMQKMSKTERMPMRTPQRDMRMSAGASYERGFDNRFERRAQMNRTSHRMSTTTYYGGGYDDRGYNSGFWPADAAGAVVGGAVGAAGAIATAPFRDTYAAYDDGYDNGPVVSSTVNTGYYDSGWNNGWNNNWDNNWARRQSVEQGGFICTPGTWYTNSYGYSQLCQ